MPSGLWLWRAWPRSALGPDAAGTSVGVGDPSPTPAPRPWGPAATGLRVPWAAACPESQPPSAEDGPCLAELEEAPLTVKSDMGAVVRAMQLPDSGLEIRDRMWLKITIANAVIGEWPPGAWAGAWAGEAGSCLTGGSAGADVVDWLYSHVEGFRERREARRYASSMLKRGFLRHTVNKVTFSEQCYYVFGDLCSSEWGAEGGGQGRPHCPHRPFLLPDLEALNLNSGSSGASDQDTLAPLPHPAPWPLGQGYPYQYPGPPPCFPPAYQDPGFSYGSGSAGSQQSEGESPLVPSSPCRLALPCVPARLPCALRLLCARVLGGLPLQGQVVEGVGEAHGGLGGVGQRQGTRRCCGKGSWVAWGGGVQGGLRTQWRTDSFPRHLRPSKEPEAASFTGDHIPTRGCVGS